MSLYGDLPVAKNEKDGSSMSSWSGKAKVLAPPTLRKRAMISAPLAPAVLKRPARPEPAPDSSGAAVESGSGAMGTMSGASSKTEYDPAKPNDYEEIRRKREMKRQQAEAEAERQAKLKEEEARQEEQRRLAALRPAPEPRDSALKISGEEAFLRRGRMSSQPGNPTADRQPSPERAPGGLGLGAQVGGFSGGSATGGGGGGGGMSAAQRMMEKMGWKAGEGLGKARQGMVTPLMAQKTDTHSAVIVNAHPTPVPAAEKKPAGVSFQGIPTTIVLLRNMVGPGEVDEQLEDEVAEECSKYGQVNRVLIFEVTEPDFPPTEAVRIFIQFDRIESATKALVDLEGRFFGGRVVRATFFSEEKLDTNDLAPEPSEIGN